MENNNQITKGHSLITAKMQLTSKEQDLLTMLVISLTKSSYNQKFKPVVEGDEPLVQTSFTFTLKELSNITSLKSSTLKKIKYDKEGKALITSLEKACDSLSNKKIKIRDENGSFDGKTLVPNAKYNASSGILTLETTLSMAKILLDYGIKNNNFGQIDHDLYFTLGGEYEKRILELISRFKNTKDFNCSFSTLCENLGTTWDSQTKISNVKMSVLTRPLAAIVKQSNGLWTFQKGFSKGFDAPARIKPDSQVVFKMKYNEPKKEKLVSEKVENVRPDGASDRVWRSIEFMQRNIIEDADDFTIELYMSIAEAQGFTVPDAIAKIIADFDSAN